MSTNWWEQSVGMVWNELLPNEIGIGRNEIHPESWKGSEAWWRLMEGNGEKKGISQTLPRWLPHSGARSLSGKFFPIYFNFPCNWSSDSYSIVPKFLTKEDFLNDFQSLLVRVKESEIKIGPLLSCRCWPNMHNLN